MTEHANGNGKGSHALRRFWLGGASGFLGSHLLQTLSSHGHQVVATSKSGGRVHGREVAPVDILDEAAVIESARGCDGAFLCTGKVTRSREASEELYELHVLGTRAALRALRAAGVRRVVLASTSGTLAVGRDPDRIADEGCRAPLELIATWPYYRTKLYAEREALEHNQPGEFDVVIANPSLLLGPGDLRESSTSDVRKFLEGTVPAIPAGGIAYVDVRDAAEGMLLAFDKGRPGERYIFNAHNVTLSGFFQRLERISGVKAPFLKMPASRPVAIGLGKLFSKAVKAIGGEPPVDEVSLEMAQYYWYCDAAKAQRELGFSPRDPGETLLDTIEDLIARKVVFPKGSRPRTVVTL